MGNEDILSLQLKRHSLRFSQGKATILSGSKLGFCSDIVIHLAKSVPEKKLLTIF